MRESRRPDLANPNAVLWFSQSPAALRVDIAPAGEEEVDVTESEVPGLSGTWCKREMLRRRSGAIRERSSAWTSSSRAARPRCPSGSASTWPRS
ncbi:hypothetical protein E4U92_18215 [Streptomyces galbus]|uniref:Uncharacterized protein n=1 Tax=Streptomyces galbus TaxID=33898 RepID=A0A4U5X0C9_STRGB|nr:hypothetical protein E4U92_18215 [Streptomyces galbus]